MISSVQAQPAVMGAQTRVSWKNARRWGWHIPLVLIVVIFAAPYVWALSSSFKPENQLFSFPPQIIPRPVTLTNYEVLFSQFPFARWLLNSIIISTLYVVGAVTSCSMVAYSFARLKWPGRRIMFGLTIASMILPYQVTMVPVYLIFRHLGWIDTWFPLWVPAWLGVPFYIFLLRQFFLSIPPELEDAARVDGAGRLRIFLYVVVPMGRPALATVAVFALLNSWSDFIAPLIYIQTPSKMPLSLGLEFLNRSGDYVGQQLWGVMMAGSVITLLPMLGVFLVLQKQFIRGIAMGALTS